MTVVYVKTINKLIYSMALLGWKNVSYHYVFLEPQNFSNAEQKFKEECVIIGKIENALKITISVLGPFFYDTFDKKKNEKYPIELNQIKIEPRAHITSNLIKPLKLDKKNHGHTILFEGASTLRYVNQKSTLRYWVNRLLQKNSHLYSYEGIVLPDSPSDLVKPFDKKNGISVVHHSVLKKNFEIIGDLLGLRPFMSDIAHVTSVLLAPSELSVAEKLKYIEGIIRKNPKEVFLLKVHPHEAYFLNDLDYQNVVALPEQLNYLPFEFFVANVSRKLKYFGYYSSVMLFFETKSLTLVEPKNRRIRKIYKREYWSYMKLIKRDLSTLKEGAVE